VNAADTTPMPTIQFDATQVDGVQLEKRGRSWLLWSFLLCPCHLPWTLAALAAVAGSTSLGVLVRDHVWIAGTLITLAWVGGTAYGFRLIRKAERVGGACPTRTPKAP
jgi:hypothetical protein